MLLAEVERKAADIENAQEKMAATSATLAAIAEVAEAPWSGAEWAVALRFYNPRAAVLVLLLG